MLRQEFRLDSLPECRRCHTAYGLVPFCDTGAEIAATPRPLLPPWELLSTPTGIAFVLKRRRAQTDARDSGCLRLPFLGARCQALRERRRSKARTVLVVALRGIVLQGTR